MDAALIWKEMGSDCALEKLALVKDDSLQTATILSLFLDRRAGDGDDLPDNTGNRRGWWADTYAEITGDKYGSRLWLLSREKQLSTVLAKAREYAEEALGWMVEDGVAKSVDVATWFIKTGVLGIRVRIHKPDAPAIDYKYEYLWERL